MAWESTLHSCPLHGSWPRRIACTLVGSRNEKELLSNIKAAEIDLTPELVRKLTA